MTSHASPTVGRRAGFTLVEIMVVMVIIGLLAAILVPVLGGILRRTNEAAVKVEISSLESALGDFKARFGCNPPDHLHLHESAAGWASDPEGRSKVLAIWPRFRFDVPRDYLDGVSNNSSGEVHLSGAECLVFFLGGMPKKDANGRFSMTGFSKNPLNPFAPITPGTDESRDGPFFDFPSARLHEHERSPDAPDGYPDFRDSLNNQTAPYLYLSSANGRGYDPEGGFVFNHQLGNTANPLVFNRNSPYRQAAGGQSWNPKSFQIISPGYGPHESNEIVSEDFNLNGILDPGEDINNNQTLDLQVQLDSHFCPYGLTSIFDPENTGALMEQDADNITNFSAGGRLRP